MFSEAFHSTQTTCILNVSFQFAHVANLHQTKRSPRVYTECKQNANSMFSVGLHARQTFANFQICQQICKGLHRCLIGNHRFCNRFAHSMQAVSLHACKPGKLAQARNLQQIYLPVCKRANVLISLLLISLLLISLLLILLLLISLLLISLLI